MPSVIFRSLRRAFHLGFPDRESAEAFAFMACEPEIEGPSPLRVDLPIERVHGFYRARLPGGRVVAGTASHLMGPLHGMIFSDVMESEASPLVHGATVIGDWGRALLVGEKASGKTTLALRLMAAGCRVEGDEHLVIGETSAVARPRTIRVKESSLELVPSLVEAIRRSPSIATWHGLPIYSVSPSVAGKPWRIEHGEVDHLIFLESNFGGRSVLRPMDVHRAFGLLMQNAVLPAGEIGRAVARLRSLATSSRAFLLQIGDLDGAFAHLSRLTPRGKGSAAGVAAH